MGGIASASGTTGAGGIVVGGTDDGGDDDGTDGGGDEAFGETASFDVDVAAVEDSFGSSSSEAQPAAAAIDSANTIDMYLMACRPSAERPIHPCDDLRIELPFSDPDQAGPVSR